MIRTRPPDLEEMCLEFERDLSHNKFTFRIHKHTWFYKGNIKCYSFAEF